MAQPSQKGVFPPSPDLAPIPRPRPPGSSALQWGGDSASSTRATPTTSAELAIPSSQRPDCRPCRGLPQPGEKGDAHLSRLLSTPDTSPWPGQELLPPTSVVGTNATFRVLILLSMVEKSAIPSWPGRRARFHFPPWAWPLPSVSSPPDLPAPLPVDAARRIRGPCELVFPESCQETLPLPHRCLQPPLARRRIGPTHVPTLWKGFERIWRLVVGGPSLVTKIGETMWSLSLNTETCRGLQQKDGYNSSQVMKSFRTTVGSSSFSRSPTDHTLYEATCPVPADIPEPWAPWSPRPRVTSRPRAGHSPLHQLHLATPSQPALRGLLRETPTGGVPPWTPSPSAQGPRSTRKATPPT